VTVDDRVVIDLSDILAIQCECPTCGTAVSYPPAAWQPRAMNCPGCGRSWWSQGSTELEFLQQIANLGQSVIRNRVESKPMAPVCFKLQVKRSE
jgi:hypothetical protein